LRYFLLASFIIWLVPFLVFFSNPHWFAGKQAFQSTQTVQLVEQSAGINRFIVNKDLHGAFRAILFNNLKVGLLNIAGGAAIAIPTAVNLMANGLNLAGSIYIAMDQGLSLWFIFIRLLAPHIIELLGIWLTAAAGFMVARLCIRYFRYEEMPAKGNILLIIYSGVAGMFIITIAAWLEVYVTIRNYL
jgi:uncharacterized membrane protein SpoIIM required for sporulation